MSNLSIYQKGDQLAIPLFLLSVIYFYQLENLTIIEKVIAAFSLIGLLTYTYFVLNKTTLTHYADLFAIPFFILGTIHFYKIPDKTTLEKVLLSFFAATAIIDIYFSSSTFSTFEKGGAKTTII